MRLWYVPKGKGIRDQGSRVTDGIFTADSTAVHGNETAALSLFEQPFCSGIQGAKVTLLRVQAIRRIAKSSGPTVRGQRIDRTGNPVTAKHHKERAGADTGGLSVRRVVLGTLHEVTARHNGRVQTIVTGRPLGDLSYLLMPAACPSPPRRPSLPEASRQLREVSAPVGLITIPPDGGEKGETGC